MPDPTFEPVGYRYRHDNSEPWSFAPPGDRKSMEEMAEKGLQVERLYRRQEVERE